MNTIPLVHEVDGGIVTLTGDRTGATLLYVYYGGPRLLADACADRLLERIRAERYPLTICPEAVSHFLTLGLVPMPATIFREIRVLGIGDRIKGRKTAEGWEISHEVDFPYFADQSREDTSPDPERLLHLLTASVAQRVEATGPAVLMLSSGKDSTALALALARLGRTGDQCLTFTAGTDQDEDAYARALCRRLGLPHNQVCLDSREPLEEDVLTGFFRRAPLPCADDCQIPYVAALQRAGDGTVLDGSGNDVYMGHVPSRNDLRRARLRLPLSGVCRRLEALVPYATRWDQLLRDPVEHCFMQGLFRWREVARFYPAAQRKESFKLPLQEVYVHRDIFDFRAYVRGRHYDQGSCAAKAWMACAASARPCVLPWCDGDIIDYYFHLPESARFDRPGYTNKVLLREMLRQEIDYPDMVLGKRYFQFDRVGFFLANKARVYAEILGCRHWSRVPAEAVLGAAYRRLPGNPRVGVALNAWFLLSGWLNHNRHVQT